MRRAGNYLMAIFPMAIIILVFWLRWPSSDPVREKFLTISEGWTRADVVSTMGEPDATLGRDNAASVILFYQGTHGVGNVVIDRNLDAVTLRQWSPLDRDPAWKRLWNRLRTALGI
jgi:hypothetical protein